MDATVAARVAASNHSAVWRVVPVSQAEPLVSREVVAVLIAALGALVLAGVFYSLGVALAFALGVAALAALIGVVLYATVRQGVRQIRGSHSSSSRAP
jgi:hypothetical protein